MILGFFKGNEAKAKLWMGTPNPLLGGVVPRDLTALRPGKLIRIVEQALSENER
jgi:hypothetical protein